MAEIKILVVEDEHIIAQNLKHTLKKLGYVVPAIAFSGKTALKKTAEVRPNLVLMDIVLKGEMDGIEAAEHIRTDFDIPVIFVTAYADSKTLKRAKAVDPFGYILKPFDERELHINIQMVLYRHQMERKLREKEAKYRTLFETMSRGVVYQDASGQIISANAAAENILGLTLDRMQGRTSLDPRWKAIHEDGSDFPGETHPAMVALETGKPVNDVVMGVFHPNQENYRWININAIPQFKPGQTKPYQVYTTFNDITERKRTEQALRESEDRFRRLAENAQDIIYRYRLAPTPGFEYISPAVLAITGYTPEEFYADPQLGTKIVHQDDRHLLNNLDQGVLPVDTPTILRWVRKDGQVIWTEARTVPIFDDTGNSIAIEGIARDITKGKQIEETLRKQRNLLNTIFAATPDLFVLKDRNFVYQVVNPAFCQFLGKPEEGIVGQTDFELFPPPEAEMYRRDDAKVMETGKPQIQDEEVSGGEGKRWLQVAKTPVLDEAGVCVGILASVRDITKRKRVEEALRQRTAQLETLREVGLELTAQLDLEALLHSVASRAVELLGGNKGGLYLYRSDRDVLEWTVAVGASEAPIGTILHRGEGISGKILETGQPLIVDDYQRWEGRAAIYAGYPLASVVGAPIHWGEEFLGVLNVNTGSTHAFSQTDAELLSLLATQVAIAIRNARLYKQTRRDAVVKAELLKEVNHRVANNLTAIIGLLHAESRYAPSRKDATIETTLKRLIQWVNGLAEVHSMLSHSEWSPVRLSDLATRIIHAALSALPPEQRVLVEVSPALIEVSPRQASNLALVINELVINTIKYALGDRSTGCITVYIAQEEDEIILCRYQDDGAGYPAEVLSLERHDVGIYLIQRIVTMTLQGELTLVNDGGAATIMRFPAEERSWT